MKRFVLVLSMIATLGLIGCSNNDETFTDNTSQNQQTEQTPEPTEKPVAEPTEEPIDSPNMESNISMQDNDELPNFSEIIPDPKSIFKKGKVSVINSSATYACQVDGYTDKEYRKYIKEAKKKGFKYDVYDVDDEASKMFEAYTSDNKYSLALLCEKDSDSLLISCQ